MCGICGKITLSAKHVDGSLQKMVDVLRHRGPNDVGFYNYASDNSSCLSVGLGHRRLSIIDLSREARQPLPNEDRTVWVSVNGEIYNFQDLRRKLEEKGHRFRTSTDSEVILHFYEEQGEEIFRELEGMFAIAIWDEKKECLLLARDRAGEKPLFYALPNNGGLIFSSSLDSILQDSEISREPNFSALENYFRYLCIPSPDTAFKGIFKIPPAHYLKWEKGETDLHRYWVLKYSTKIKISEEEAAEECLRIMRASVRSRLTSDVPLGAFLSGGVDSSAVVALMAGVMDRPVKTFAIGFDDSSYDERSYARMVSSRFGTEHREFVVTPKATEILPEMIRHFGEPFADSSAIPMFYLAKMTREHVSVALSGDGGDECFGGYDRYVALGLSEKLRGIPGASWMGSLLGRASYKYGDSRGSWARIGRFGKALGDYPDSASRYAFLLSSYSGDVGKILTEGNGSVSSLDPVEKLMAEGMEYLGSSEAALRSDFNFYLPEDILVKVDVVTMFHSLEVRCPFLDRQLLEFTAQLPFRFKVDGRLTKAILKRRVLNGLLPPEIVYRRKKGFGVPLGKWFRGELIPMAEELILSGRVKEIVKEDFMRKVYREHSSGRRDHGPLLWQFLCLAIWYETFFK